MKRTLLILASLLVLVSPVYAYTFTGVGNVKGAQIEVDFYPETDSITCNFLGDVFTLSRPHSNPPVDLWMGIDGNISMVIAYTQKTGVLKISMLNLDTREEQRMMFKYVNSSRYTAGF